MGLKYEPSSEPLHISAKDADLARESTCPDPISGFVLHLGGLLRDVYGVIATDFRQGADLAREVNFPGAVDFCICVRT